MEQTREDLLKSMQEKLMNQSNSEHLTEVAMPGVVMPVHREDK